MREKNTILTQRERGILALSGRGLNNEEIANQLHISVSTVKINMYTLFRKLGVHSRTHAFLEALKSGQLDLHEVYSQAELIEVLVAVGDILAEMIQEKCLLPDIKDAESAVLLDHPIVFSTCQIAQREWNPGQADDIKGQAGCPALWQDTGMSQGNQIMLTARRAMLTDEQRALIILVARGLSNQEIANQLGMPINRVKNLLYWTCIKLRVRNRIEVVFEAMKKRLINVREIYSKDEMAMFLSSVTLDELDKAIRLFRQSY
jgi:DNA-binding NarL/FixJ family response regulator